MFDSAAREGLPVCFWLNSLESSRLQNAPISDLREPSECIREKILSGTRLLDKFIDSMSDGELTLEEVLQLEPLIEPAIKALEHLRESLLFQRGLLEKHRQPKKAAHTFNGSRAKR